MTNVLSVATAKKKVFTNSGKAEQQQKKREKTEER
jgi:hypothetical protein